VEDQDLKMTKSGRIAVITYTFVVAMVGLLHLYEHFFIAQPVLLHGGPGIEETEGSATKSRAF
jgi:hypothetical protein